MNSVQRNLTLTGLSLLQGAAVAFSQAPAVANAASVAVSPGSSHGVVQAMDEVQARIIESTHLTVPNSCKWGHAAFEPVHVGSEPLSAEAQAIYSQMEMA